MPRWRPQPDLIDSGTRLLKRLGFFVSPVFYGMDRIPEDRPLLLVGNHTLMGLWDAPFLWAELYQRKGIFPRALGDHTHFAVPGWRELVTAMGVVDGTRDNCGRLMGEAEVLLVFPGGAREVAKRRGEKYKLIWKDRLGFVKMALQHGCTIQPFSSLGADDAWDIVMDADDLLRHPLFGPAVKRMGLRHDVIPPLVRGAFGPLPRGERLYFYFGKPIQTGHLQGLQDDDEACRALRDQVRAEVQHGIDWLQLRRAEDPHRKLLPRLRHLLGIPPGRMLEGGGSGPKG